MDATVKEHPTDIIRLPSPGRMSRGAFRSFGRGVPRNWGVGVMRSVSETVLCQSPQQLCRLAVGP